MVFRFTFACLLVAAPSHSLFATTYASANKGTVLMLNESPDLHPHTTGHYTTYFQNREIFGTITIDSAEGAAGSTFYRGEFTDRTVGPAPTLNCSGLIIIRRQNHFEMGRRMAIDVKWMPTAGTGCMGTIGQTLMLSLQETLPVADSRGEYHKGNSNTMRSETNGDVTWLAWEVTSSDGELHCRSEPAGSIVSTYSESETIVAETRGANAFVEKDKKSWMRTRKGCFVRAHSDFIAPLSLPETYLP